MAARSVTLTSIRRAGGKIYVRFGKREYEFNSLTEVRAYVEEKLGRETLECLFLALLVERQPDINNPALVEGRTLTVDMALTNWGRVS
jgi:hypothetical protein